MGNRNELRPWHVAALRFLNAVRWRHHNWMSVHAGIVIQLGSMPRGQNAATVIRWLRSRGYVEARLGLGPEARITDSGRAALMVHDIVRSKRNDNDVETDPADSLGNR